jgi:CBS domain containing-hemolysin-like protein
MPPLSSILILIGLIILSSFFSMSETVFSSINPIRLKNAIDEKKPGSKKALWVHDHFDLTLSTILVGNNLANIAIASVSLGVVMTLFNTTEAASAALNTLIMTTVILIFGEIIPKSYGKSYSDTIALKISGVMYFVIKLLRPVTAVFINIKRVMIKDDHTVTITVTEDELETIIDTMEEEGSIDEDEAEMLQSVLDLRDKKVKEIMTPRVDMIALDETDDVETIKALFFEHQFSRMPVFAETRDNVIGILNERDFFTMLITGAAFDLKQLVKKPIFVPKAMRVDTLIETLQRENMHLAVVTDEYGGTSGIVTMEDALEELVGEIYDEHDDIEPDFIQRESANDYLLNADISMHDLFDELDLGDPVNPDESVGSYIYNQFEDIVEEGTVVSYTHSKASYDHDTPDTRYELKFVIKKIDERRIKTVLLTIDILTEKEET